VLRRTTFTGLGAKARISGYSSPSWIISKHHQTPSNSVRK